jgi:hypothetical protein
MDFGFRVFGERGSTADELCDGGSFVRGLRSHGIYLVDIGTLDMAVEGDDQG